MLSFRIYFNVNIIFLFSSKVNVLLLLFVKIIKDIKNEKGKVYRKIFFVSF